MGPNQLNAAIDVFTSDVTRYLLPVICYVGHKDDLFEPLQRQYPGTIHRKRYLAENSHVTIFDHIPHDLLSADNPLSADSSYIFILDGDFQYTEQELLSLQRLNSITLLNPEPGELFWQIKALLLVQSLTYANARSVFPSLLSIDVDYRQTISTIIRNVIECNSSVVSVCSESVRQALISFLFDSMPNSISPLIIKGGHEAISSLPVDRLCFIDGSSHQMSDIVSLYQHVSSIDSAVSVMAILVNQDLSSLNEIHDVHTVSLPELHSRSVDAHLLAYWCSAQQSHTIHKMAYHSIHTVNQTSSQALYCPVQFLSLLGSQDARDDESGDILTELVSTFDRSSIDSIMSEVERMVMSKLRDQCSIVESASHAAGIPRVTYNKRSRRLSDRQSLLNLLSNS